MYEFTYAAYNTIPTAQWNSSYIDGNNNQSNTTHVGSFGYKYNGYYPNMPGYDGSYYIGKINCITITVIAESIYEADLKVKDLAVRQSYELIVIKELKDE